MSYSTVAGPRPHPDDLPPEFFEEDVYETDAARD